MSRVIITDRDTTTLIETPPPQVVTVTTQGAQGPRGPEGLPGEPGADGIPGADGADGKTILSGTGAPAPELGADGDIYLDTAATTIYGPRTSGEWGTGVSLVGPAGANGAPGEQGPPGSIGPAGPGLTPLQGRWIEHDLESGTGTGGFGSPAGLSQAISTPPAHLGAIRLRASTAADSGVRILPASTASLLGGAGMAGRIVLRLLRSEVGMRGRIGFQSQNDAGTSLHGVYCQITDDFISFRTRVDNDNTTSFPLYTYPTNTWLTFDFEWLTDSSARCVISNDTGDILADWTSTTTVPGPGAPNKALGMGVVVWHAETAGATRDLADVDRIEYGPQRPPWLILP